MPKTVSATEAKVQFGSIVEWAVQAQDDVIVESRGEPRAVIISFEEYKRVLAMREQARREDALRRLRALREEVRASSADLTEEQALALATRFSKEVHAELADAAGSSGE